MESSSGRVMAFMAFAAVAAGTPGPGNVMLAAVGARVGVRRGMKSLLGQVIGMTAMLFAVTLGLGGLLLDHAWTLEILKWGGAALLCWMAWGIATAKHIEGAAEAPTGFLGMAAFQWANPKGWLIAAAADATFLDRHGGALGQAVGFAVLFLLAALPSCLPWLAFGAALQRFLRTPRTWLVFRCAMAGLLAASVVLFVVPHG
ncbi:LysE family translocator [Actinomadura opuntiae]|uniref:LysE family translocator n=1 Tax=Actinomadura sp. OS1-43 TaxID=604315 RepID=UPI00255AE330|nr:LysE family translocator [Actinomadura sp. OS1-43]MDL4818413.1 LysE family translocator [Actinomadura sp. OS1-43]